MPVGAAEQNRISGGRNHLLAAIFSEYFVLILTALLLLSLAPLAEGLATPATALNVLGYLVPLFIAATGLTLVMITGGIDLSITAVIALSSVVGATIMTGQAGISPTTLGVAAMLAVGIGIGTFNGALVTFLKLPAFMVTLASMLFFNGFAVWFTHSKNISGLPAGFLAIGKQLPIAVMTAILLGIAVFLALRHTLFGRWLFALGQNSIAAHISGVPVQQLTFLTYVLSGACAALASIFLTSRLETGSPVLGREMLLDVVGATVIGGTSLFGGRGQVHWTFFGVLFLTLLDTALNLMNLSQFAITISKGSVILFAAVFDAIRRRFQVFAS
jgi:ribose transport system permease protein